MRRPKPRTRRARKRRHWQSMLDSLPARRALIARIEEIRAGRSMREFAEAMAAAGLPVAKGTIAQVLNGCQLPSWGTISRMYRFSGDRELLALWAAAVAELEELVKPKMRRGRKKHFDDVGL